MNLLKIIVIISLFVSCQSESSMNWIISTEGNDAYKSSSILYIFESSNYNLLNEDKVLFRKYLNTSEIEIATLNIDSLEITRAKHTHQYHLLHEEEFAKFKIALIGKSILGKGRNYSVLLRTFNLKEEIISTLSIAHWNESSKKYFGCKIFNDWKTIYHLNNGDILREFSMDNSGNLNNITQ